MKVPQSRKKIEVVANLVDNLITFLSILLYKVRADIDNEQYASINYCCHFYNISPYNSPIPYDGGHLQYNVPNYLIRLVEMMISTNSRLIDNLSGANCYLSKHTTTTTTHVNTTGSVPLELNRKAPKRIYYSFLFSIYQPAFTTI